MKRILVVAHPHWQTEEWDQAYWLILGHLNFDHSVRLLCLPDALTTLQHSGQFKSWQALPMYGLEGGFGLNQSKTDGMPLKIIDQNGVAELFQWADTIL